MTKLNHNRPHFKRTEIWQKFDKYLAPCAAPTASGSLRGSHRQRSTRLDPFLELYCGDDPILLEAKERLARGEILTPSLASTAGHRMNRVVRMSY